MYIIKIRFVRVCSAVVRLRPAGARADCRRWNAETGAMFEEVSGNYEYNVECIERQL
jgi:hypothetical protein